MKKLLLLTIIAAGTLVFTRCNSTKKTASSKQALSYATNVQPLLADKCSPCHFPDKGGRVKALNTYESVSSNIDDIIRRIEMNPGDRGFMPFKHPKLADAEINTFKTWKADGLAK